MNSPILLSVQSPLIIDLLTGGARMEPDPKTGVVQLGGDVNVNKSQGVVTSSATNWLDPYKHPPENGKILLLSWDNIQSSGIWGSDGHIHYAAWAPLHSRPDWLKERMWAKYKWEYIPKPVRS